MNITDSEFKGNTAGYGGNNIYNSDKVTCNDGTNTFEFPSGGVTSKNDFQGNFPADVCAS
jgi:hypothetical protein